jgi:two-component system catabolic regulation response regulator CreB
MKRDKSLVLIVEDESVIAETIVYVIENEGHETKWVTTGQDAIDFTKELEPDLIVLDVGLPDKSGFEVCREIRSFSEAPIFFLTSRHGDIDEIRGLECGADDYLKKPFTPQVLAVRITSKLRRAVQAVSTKTVKHELKEDTLSAVVSLDEHNMDFTRYEYLIISHMMKQPSRKFGRDELLSAASLDSDSFDRTIDTHIKTIRKKIQQVRPGYDPIKTYRSLGYAYEPEK